MTVDEELAVLKNAITEIMSRYCENCQEWECDYCQTETDNMEHMKVIEDPSHPFADSVMMGD